MAQGTVVLICRCTADRCPKWLADRMTRLGRLEGPARQAEVQPLLPHLVMPAHHDVRPEDVVAHRLHGNLAAAADRGPADFPSCCLRRAWARGPIARWRWMMAEVVHGAPCRFSDPGRFSFAHVGKNRHPFPVPLKVLDETIKVWKVWRSVP